MPACARSAASGRRSSSRRAARKFACRTPARRTAAAGSVTCRSASATSCRASTESRSCSACWCSRVDARRSIVLGLLLLARRRRELELLAVGLAGGYALALLVTAGSWVAPRTSFLEGFVGFMGLWIAAALVARETSRSKVAAILGLGSCALAAVATLVSGWAAGLVLLG